MTTTATASFDINCIHESVVLRAAHGAVRADAVRVGDALVQPDGSTSRVVRVSAARIFPGTARRDARLFQDPSGRALVTAFHAVRFGAHGDFVAAWLHPEMTELVDAELLFPTNVFHFQLQDPAHVIGVADTDVWLESLDSPTIPLQEEAEAEAAREREEEAKRE